MAKLKEKLTEPTVENLHRRAVAARSEYRRLRRELHAISQADGTPEADEARGCLRSLDRYPSVEIEDLE